MGKNTSISIGDHFENFINQEISSGRYNSASEVVRSALRLLEIEEQKTIALRTAIETGEQSGIATDFNPENHLKSLRSKHL